MLNGQLYALCSVFVPLQSFLVNPANVAPESPAPANSSSSPGSYFTEAAVLAAVPDMFLVLAATYAAVFALAVAVTVGPPEKEVDTEGEKVGALTFQIDTFGKSLLLLQ